ncbi:MAG: tRNA pseudouridine(55) synthase TruB [Candidatus Omnitrophica bacterium]|nr:tRNA pseudouridine(55) synthase TruB [Candidatus Omnitrophota bacterium]MDD5352803.1 tRNA pseudouridine(55) synthase TruB [Candidatus Omnitrophota bacterium]MDD5550402.1 tRNA pseudouridine(55) synthase TruB [Candidatus Omnitrophota bacterium]
MNGIIIIDKPAGMTSFDIVQTIRRRFKIKRVGHCGTLDPLATGLLIMLLGKDTKLFSKFSTFDKVYKATLELGLTTSTGDCEGKVLRRCGVDNISISEIEKVFKEFMGEITQVPPMFSALKYRGKKLYELARLGIEVPRKKRQVNIYDLKICDFHSPYVDFYVHCSKGTYIRTLAHDIGAQLGCGACIVKIRRTLLGPFNIKDAITIDRLDESHIRNWPS